MITNVLYYRVAWILCQISTYFFKKCNPVCVTCLDIIIKKLAEKPKLVLWYRILWSLYSPVLCWTLGNCATGEDVHSNSKIWTNFSHFSMLNILKMFP